MATRMKDLGVDRLSASERIVLAQGIWDSLAREAETAPLTDEQKREIDRRLAAYEADPDAVIPWE